MAKNNGAATLPAKSEPPQEVEKAPAKPRDAVIGGVLEKLTGRINSALPPHMRSDRMIEVARTLIFRTPKLQQCDTGSIAASIMRACSLGLDLEPSMMEGFLIPRWNDKIQANECNFQVGYMGLRKLALQSDEIKIIETVLVRENDEFDYYRDPTPHLMHRPKFGPSAGPVILMYSYARLTNGEPSIEIMTVDEIELIHQRSESYRNAIRYKKAEFGPWISDWNEMGRKTVLRRHCKSLPRSLDLAKALEWDNEHFQVEDDERPEPRQITSRGTAGLKQALAIEQAEEPAFDASEGVARPLRTEADEADDLPEGEGEDDREPGSDG
jgi:recombination protein RecT